MKYGSFWWMFQPRSFGRITLWPRLDTGKSSETPWSSPMTSARGYEISAAATITRQAAPGRGAERFGPLRNHASTKNARPTHSAAIPCFT